METGVLVWCNLDDTATDVAAVVNVVVEGRELTL